MNKHALCLLGLVLCLGMQTASAQSVTTKPDNIQTLAQAWQWAQTEMLRQDQAWVGYSFASNVDERLRIAFTSRNQDYIEWNRASNQGWGSYWYYNSGNGWQNRQSIAALQAGVQTAQQDYPAAREIMFLMRVANGDVKEIHVVPVDSLVNWRSAPVYWLGEFNSTESSAHLLELLPLYSEQSVQGTLVRALGLHTNSERDRSLLALLDDDAYSAILPATLEALAMQKSDLVREQLAIVAGDENGDLIARRIVISALSRYGDAATTRLLAELSAVTNPQAIRREAIESLALIPGDISEQVLEEIVVLDDNRVVVVEALRGLARNPAQYPTIAALAESHSDAEVRETALQLAARMDSTQAFSLLQAAFDNDPDADVREQALKSMDTVPAGLAVPFLLEVAENANAYDEDLRAEAVETLAEFSPALVIDDLNRLAWSDGSEDVRENAVQALAELGDATVNGLLLELARNHPSNHTRREAMDELQDRLL